MNEEDTEPIETCICGKELKYNQLENLMYCDCGRQK